MLIIQKPQKVEIKHHVCDFHKRHPEQRNYAGCTCCNSWSTRDKRPDEYTEEERLKERAERF
jgi:hypothetical protein